MKLLVDENLAPELAEQLADLFPGSVHVTAVGLGSMSDAVIWEYAGANQFTFLTKDKDFVNLSLTLGSPPKVILLQPGNCSTSQIERIIRFNAVRFSEFDNDSKSQSASPEVVIRCAGAELSPAYFAAFAGSPAPEWLARVPVRYADL